MKERPILFSGPMVRAILEGRKTQTRRVVGWPEWLAMSHDEAAAELNGLPREAHRGIAGWRDGKIARRFTCPFGAPGDRLWVKETWQPLWKDPDEPGDIRTGVGLYVNYPATDGVCEWHHEDDGLVTRCRPSIFMPRWASRITLEVTGVRVERLQDISAEDAKAEGLNWAPGTWGVNGVAASWHPSSRAAFRVLWESINGADSWAANPWVWCVSFKRVDEQRSAA